MPYIKGKERDKYNGLLRELANTWNLNGALAGDLNYIITFILKDRLKQELNYSTINELVGVMECAKLELYRKVVAPYEDQKAIDNGDVL